MRTTFTKLLFLCLGACMALASPAQVSVQAKIDSTQIRIGSQAHITLSVTTPERAKVQWPTFAKNILTPEVEVVESIPLDSVVEQGRMTQSRRYAITSFTDSLYSLPPIEVQVDGKAYRTQPLALKVIDDFVPIDSTNPDRYYGATSVVYPPFDWNEWWPLLFPALAILLAVCIGIALLLRQRNHRRTVRFVTVEAPKPAHVVALSELRLLTEEKPEENEEAVKAYYTRMTDALRTYMASRFRFNAMEMTTSEIITHLRTVDDVEGFNELRSVLETADLVKFAKYQAMLGETDQYLVKAVNFVNETKIEQPDAPKTILQRIPIEERERRRALLKLRLGALAAFAVAVVCAAYIIIQLSYLMV